MPEKVRPSEQYIRWMIYHVSILACFYSMVLPWDRYPEVNHQFKKEMKFAVVISKIIDSSSCAIHALAEFKVLPLTNIKPSSESFIPRLIPKPNDHMRGIIHGIYNVPHLLLSAIFFGFVERFKCRFTNNWRSG